MFYCPVCGFLCLFLLFWGHIGVAIGDTYAAFAGEYLVPDARCGVASVYIVEVVTVPAERVAEGMACVLYGGATGYEQQCGILLQDIACAGKNAVVHNGLAAGIARKSRVGGCLCVRPCLKPAELCLRLVEAYAVDESAEPWFVTALYAAVVAGLLERDIVPPAQTQCLLQGVGFVDCADSVLYQTETVGGGIPVKKAPVLLQ